MKNFLKIISLIFLSIIITSCSVKDSCLDNGGTFNPETKKCEYEISEKIKIVSSINPITSIVNYIGGDEVEAENIVPAGVSPHHFELTPQNLISLENANIVFSIGLEHIDGFLDKNENKNKIKLSDGIELLDAEEHEHDELDDEHDEDEDHDDENHDKDPHIWLSEKNLKIISEKITKKLTEIKPEKEEYFLENKNNFDSEIENIFKNFKEENKNKEIEYFIVFHDAYNYLLETLEIPNNKKLVFNENVSSEISPSSLKELIDEIKEHDIKIIFKEPQFNSKQIENLAFENNLKIFILDPIGSDSSKNGFIENLKNNLENLKNIYK